MRWPTAVTVLRAGMVILVVALTLVTTLLVTGPFGLVVAADCLAALGLVIALAVTPGSAAERPVRQAGGAQGWLARTGLLRRAGRPAVQAADFPAYAKISSDLGWAHVSQWHYDHGVRPLLARLAQSALAEHHRVDAAVDPARARRLVGDDIWPFVDPSRPPSFDSKTPGVGPHALARIVDRLEQL